MLTEYIVAYDCKRLDLYLKDNTEYSRSHIKTLCESGKVTVLGKQAKVSTPVKQGDVIKLEQIEPKKLDLTPQNLPLDIIYQDEDIAVINKAQGVTVHAGGGTTSETLVNALLYHLDSLSGINGVIRPGIVHRIDKDTSGLLVVAKNDTAHLSLSKQISEKTAKRIYVALLEGVVKTDEGKIETYISRSEKDRKMMAVSNSGRIAITYYKVLKRYKKYTLCEFSLMTGRTHQIRVHSKHIGHPIVGDKVYGFKKPSRNFSLEGQLLHAKKLVLTHPKTGKEMAFSAPLPDYFEKVINTLDREEKA